MHDTPMEHKAVKPKFSRGDRLMWKYRAEWEPVSTKIMVITCVMEDAHDIIYEYQYINTPRPDSNIYPVYATYYEGNAVRLTDPNKIWKELNE